MPTIVPEMRGRAFTPGRRGGLMGFALFLALAAVWVPTLALAQTSETGGIGGTGIHGGAIAPDTGGIGGTGIRGGRIAPETGGIGGTGAPIVGLGPIQKFGSVFVNGREYGVNARTLVTIDGRPATVAALRVGDMALVRGVAIGAHGGFARSIASWQSIVGPVATIASDHRSFTVLGQTVTAPASAPGFASVRPGDVVGVSAQRTAGGTWVAHRVAILPQARSFRLETTVSAVGRHHVALGGLSLRATPAMLAGLRPGDRVVVTGTVANGRPELAAIKPEPIVLGPPGTRVEIENYFRATGGGHLVAPDGIEASGAEGTALTGFEPAEIKGEIESDGRIAITTIAPRLPGFPAPAGDEQAEPERNGASPSHPVPRNGEAIDHDGASTPAGDASTKAERSGEAEAAHSVEPPEVGEAPEPGTPEIEPPEIELPEQQTPEPDIDAPEVEPPTDN